MKALRLQKDNTKLAGLLEDALNCIDQYDYEEAFDLVQRIKDALNHSRMSHPPVVPWGGSSLTEMEELLQKTHLLELENSKLREELKDVKRVRYSLEEALDRNCDEAEKGVQFYRIQFEGCGCIGTYFFRVQRRGWFGLWWTVQTALTLEAAERLIIILRRLDAACAKDDKP